MSSSPAIKRGRASLRIIRLKSGFLLHAPGAGSRLDVLKPPSGCGYVLITVLRGGCGPMLSLFCSKKREWDSRLCQSRAMPGPLCGIWAKAAMKVESRGSSVKPGDAMNDDDTTDDELLKTKLSKNDLKRREINLLQMRGYRFAQGKGISLSSPGENPTENSHHTAAGLRKIRLRGEL